MATQTLEFTAATGLTISCKLFAVGSDTVVDTQTAAEATNRKNRYTVEFTDVPAGAYLLIGFVGGVGGFANEIYDLTLSTGTFYPRSEQSLSGGSGDWTDNEKTAIKSILGVPASGATPATPTTGVLASIKSKTDQLTQNTSVSIVNPFNRQTRTLTLVQRCDFTTDSVGGPVRIPLEETNLTDGDTIRFGAWRGVETIEADGTIEETDTGFDAVIPLTATDLDVEAGADWRYDVKHIDGAITSPLLANQILVVVESSDDPE